jgi:hypothetical protein
LKFVWRLEADILSICCNPNNSCCITC